jgi:hypothetical protein
MIEDIVAIGAMVAFAAIIALVAASLATGFVVF